MSPENTSTYGNVGNPWFTVSIGLLCLIAGYGVGQYRGGTLIPAAPSGDQVAQAPTAPTVPDAPAAPSNPASVDDDPVLGDDSAKVTLIEFTDYQCPFCHRHFTDTFGQIKKDYVDTGKIKYVIRDYPLSFHPNAEPAAIASECAHAQGKFWEMHDKLFTNNPTWSDMPDAVPTFKQYAADLGLNTAKFNTCMDSKAPLAEIQKDQADGSNAGINGTPGFWLIGPDGKGQMISGAMPYATFKQAIDGML